VEKGEKGIGSNKEKERWWCTEWIKCELGKKNQGMENKRGDVT